MERKRPDVDPQVSLGKQVTLPIGDHQSPECSRIGSIMRYSTLIVPIALLAIPATANAAGCQPAFVGADQTVMVDGVDIGSLNYAVRDFSVRVQNKAGPSGQPGAMGGGDRERMVEVRGLS